MSSAITTTEPDALAFIQNPSAEVLQEVLGQGNLAKLNSGQRLEFLAAVCRSIGLNPLTRPFDIMTLQGKVVVYAKKDCTEQLRKINSVSVAISGQVIADDVLIVTARATLPSGRFDEDIGAVSVKGLSGEALSNARMKAITKAKRRVTLSICGLGFLDESEIESVQAQHEPNHAQPISDYPNGRPAGRMAGEQEPDSEPVEEAQIMDHWSLLLPDNWRNVKIQSGPYAKWAMMGVVQDAEASKWAASNLDPHSLEGMALFASRWIRIERVLAGIGMDTKAFEAELLKAGLLVEGQSVFDVRGEFLGEFYKFAKSMQEKPKGTEPNRPTQDQPS